MPRRRIHPPEFKAQVALDALCSRTSLSEVAARYQLHPVQVCQWKQQLVKRLPELFRHQETTTNKPGGNISSQELDRLKAENASLLNELQWLKKKLYSCDQLILRSLLEPGHPSISLRRQCNLLGAARSSYYYQPASFMNKNSAISRQIDRMFRDDQSISQRALVEQLREDGFSICKNSLHQLLCRLGFAPFERKLATLLASRLAEIPPLPFRAQDLKRRGERWILDFAYWPSPQVDLYAALLIDAGSSSLLAWGLADHISATLVTDLLRVAMESHPLPLLLQCETFLPFLSSSCLRRLQQDGISLVAPIWPEKIAGSSRATALSPLWRSLKNRADALRSAHSQADEQWILQQSIHLCHGPSASQAPQENFGNNWPSGEEPWLVQSAES